MEAASNIGRAGWQLHWETSFETCKVKVKEVAHDNEVNDLGDQDKNTDVSVAIPVSEFRERRHPEGHFDEARETERRNEVADEWLDGFSRTGLLLKEEKLREHCERLGIHGVRPACIREPVAIQAWMQQCSGEAAWNDYAHRAEVGR